MTSNLWVEAGLVNGALGTIKKIFYYHGLRPPQLPIYTNVSFHNYIGIPWDMKN
jgi:ATP-dependent DNA helicase PIF1